MLFFITFEVIFTLLHLITYLQSLAAGCHGHRDILKYYLKGAAHKWASRAPFLLHLLFFRGTLCKIPPSGGDISHCSARKTSLACAHQPRHPVHLRPRWFKEGNKRSHSNQHILSSGRELPHQVWQCKMEANRLIHFS